MGRLRVIMDRGIETNDETVEISLRLTEDECGFVCAGLQNVLEKTKEKQAKFRVKLKEKIRLVRMQKYRQTRTRSLIYCIPETTFKERQTKESLLKDKARLEKKIRQSLILKRQLTTQLKGFKKKTTTMRWLMRKFQERPMGTASVYGNQMETDIISVLPSDGGIGNLSELFAAMSLE